MHYQLDAGDDITVGVTQEVTVGRDKTWVKYEGRTKVRPGEATDDAVTRAVGHVNEAIMIAIHKTVETVRNNS